MWVFFESYPHSVGWRWLFTCCAIYMPVPSRDVGSNLERERKGIQNNKNDKRYICVLSDIWSQKSLLQSLTHTAWASLDFMGLAWNSSWHMYSEFKNDHQSIRKKKTFPWQNLKSSGSFCKKASSMQYRSLWIQPLEISLSLKTFIHSLIILRDLSTWLPSHKPWDAVSC